VGYDGIFTGSGRITRGGDPATLIMTESSRRNGARRQAVRRRSRCAAGFHSQLAQGEDQRPNHGRIRRRHRHWTVSGGRHQSRRSRRPGAGATCLGVVFELGGYVRDTVDKGYLGGMSRLGAKNVRLPDERHRLRFMVFKTFDQISYGLIMEAEGHHSRARPGRESLVHWKKSPAALFVPCPSLDGTLRVDLRSTKRAPARLSDISFLSLAKKRGFCRS